MRDIGGRCLFGVDHGNIGVKLELVILGVIVGGISVHYEVVATVS